MGFGHSYQTSPTHIEGEPPAYWQAQHAIMPGYGAFCRGNAPASRPSPQRGPVDPAMRDQNLHSLRVRVTQLEQNLRAAEKALTKKDRRIERLRQDAVDTGLENLKLNNFQDRALKAEAQRHASERRARDLEAENAQLVSENAGLRDANDVLLSHHREHQQTLRQNTEQIIRLEKLARTQRLKIVALNLELEDAMQGAPRSERSGKPGPKLEVTVQFNGRETDFARMVKREFAKMFHSDAGSLSPQEQKYRTEIFKLYWESIQSLAKQAKT